MTLRDKIQSQFDSYPELRVLFFFDKDKEYEEEIKQIEISDVTFIRADKAHFGLKIKLEHKLSEDKVVLYFPYAKPLVEKDLKKFILLDLLVANRELLLDNVEDFMSEWKLLPVHRIIAARYINDLKKKKHQAVLGRILHPQYFEEKEIIRGLLSSYLGFNSVVEPTIILAKLFTLTLPENHDTLTKFIKRVPKEELLEAIISWLETYIGIKANELTPDLLVTAVRKLKYNLLVQHVPQPKAEDTYSQLKISAAMTLQMTRAVAVDWVNHPVLSKELNRVFEITGKEVQESKIVELYGNGVGYLFYTDKLKMLILSSNIGLMQENPHSASNAIQALALGENDREEVKKLVSYLAYVAQYFQKLSGIGSYILDSPEEYLEQYANSYSQIDFLYRKLLVALKELDKLELPELIVLDHLNESIHKSYEDYLVDLNYRWMKCMEQNSFKFNEIDVPKQYEFYAGYLEGSDIKVAVIISDALRYECAGELCGELLGDPKGDASIKYALASIPSTTKWGMANLLSGNVLEYDDGKITINGLSTSGTDNRAKVLRTHTEDAYAIQYKNIITKDRSAGRELFKKPLVYIYHNVIDAVGDDKSTEMGTFNAVSDAISDLKSLVKKIHSSYNVSKIIVTADHGFLFNYRELSNASFQKSPAGDHIEEHNRYLVTSDLDEVTNSYILNLSDTANTDSSHKVVVPKAINRYKRQGSGMHFVHGGSSLQELVVPIIVSTRKREDVSERVPFQILNEVYKIVSGAIKIRIFQTEPVGIKAKAREVVAGLYSSSSELVSNEVVHTLDSVSSLPVERTREFILNLSNKASQQEILMLKIFDIDDKDKLNPVVSTKVFNNTLIETDF
jgi:uncharacterized protein (TIGR02687 family)